MDGPNEHVEQKRGGIGPRGGALCVAAALLLGEAGLRLGGYGQRLAVASDAALGWVLLPGQDRVQDGRSVRVNRDGHYGEDWSTPEVAVERVAVLGSSFSVGPWVQMDEGWPRLLADRLDTGINARFNDPSARQSRAGESAQSIEVMNLAVSGYGIEQMRRLYDAELAAYQPEWLIVELNSGAPLPTIVPADGESRLRRYLIRSALYDAWTRYVTRDRGAEVSPPKTRAERRAMQARRKLAAAPLAPEFRGTWDAVRIHLEALVASQAAHGGKVIVLAVPMAGHVLESAGLRPVDLLREWDVAQDVEIVDPLEAFRASPADLYLVHDPVHWTAAGHALIANVVYGAIR